MIFGLDAAEWTALGTIALTIATIAYVIVTARLAKQASRSAESSERAAIAAEKSAASAQRSARVAELQMAIDFEAEYEEAPHVDEPWLRLFCRGDRVFIHAVRLEGTVRELESQRDRLLVKDHLAWFRPDQGPHEMQRNESVMFDWPGKRVDLAEQQNVVAVISWSIEQADAPRPYRPIQVLFPRDSKRQL